MAGAEVRHEPREQEAGGGAEHADAEGAAPELAHLSHRLARVGERREHAFRLGAKGKPGLGQDDAAADAGEELDAELGLERAHLLGERGLGEVERRAARLNEPCSAVARK